MQKTLFDENSQYDLLDPNVKRWRREIQDKIVPIALSMSDEGYSDAEITFSIFEEIAANLSIHRLERKMNNVDKTQQGAV